MKIKFGSHFNLCENVLKSETNASEDKQTIENDENRSFLGLAIWTGIIDFNSGQRGQGHISDGVELIKSDSSIAINLLGKFYRMNYYSEELHD